MGEYIFVKEGKCFQIVEVNIYFHIYGLDNSINKQALPSQKGVEWVLCLGPEKGKTAHLCGLNLGQWISSSMVCYWWGLDGT